MERMEDVVMIGAASRPTLEKDCFDWSWRDKEWEENRTVKDEEERQMRRSQRRKKKEQ